MSTRPGLLFVFGVAAVIAAAVGVGLIASVRSSAASSEAASRTATMAAGPRVVVVPATRGAAERGLELQGEARPFATVTLYAKLSGYLKEIRVDKGDRVQANQILAVIESPELDRQYDAAVADANYHRLNAKRAEALAGPGVVSAREAELETSQAQIANATVASLATQKSYETLRAPFDGLVTARFADRGALVQNAANAQTSALPLVTITQPDKLRVYVYVDQRDAALVHVGDAALVSVPGAQPEVQRKGKISRFASDLDPKTRMMLVEIDLDNRDGKIVPGSYVSVALAIRAVSHIEVPVEALIIRDKKPFVAVVGADNHLAYRPVVIADNDGSRVQILSGLDEGAKVALNLGDSASDGDLIQPVTSGDKHDARSKN